MYPFHLFKSFPQFVMIHTVKSFSIVNETEIDVFLKFSCFLYNPVNVVNVICSSSSLSKPSLDIWKFLVHIMLKPSMQDFKYDLTNMGDECNCPMDSTFFGTTLLENWDEDWTFPLLWSLLGLPDSWHLHEPHHEHPALQLGPPSALGLQEHPRNQQ